MTDVSWATAWQQHFHNFTTDCFACMPTKALNSWVCCAFGNVYSVLYSISLMWKVENTFTSCTEVVWKESNSWNGLHGIIFIAQVEMFSQFHRLAATSVYHEGINWDKKANIQLLGVIMWLTDFPIQRLHDIRDLGTFGKRSKLKSKFLKWSTLILAINYFVTMMMMRTVQGNKKYGRILNMRRLTLSLSTRQYIWHKEQAFDVVISVMVSKMTEWFNFM